ncbi:hypothetical protein KBZ12_11635 [Cyanobium sp. Cruz CV13-4-11]|uniref:hypothetical protein n=1 Tax=unclassified Cyanobium TaxID=2627006 RepID=UPI0020CB6C9C|nr:MULTISPECIES: hypothetical protein [unclassified Cyanobium]MCP9900962.1 hypothetical protein [Cyanobium sp. Cruz CV11-17]MCP9920117.1 hypothetical protein [Cyanobium sp. Cruz CV13-4-11]
MSATPPASATEPTRSLSFLVAPLGQLSEDGQLRELIEERRQCKGAAVELWYLGPDLVEELCLRPAFSHPAGKGDERRPSEKPIEVIVAGEAAVITWLQLRFGGCTGTLAVPTTWLQERAGRLPPLAPASNTASSSGSRRPWGGPAPG